MERILVYIRIFPGTEEEYDRRHREIWPEMVAALQTSGIRNYTGFRRGTDVWYYGECQPDQPTAFARQAATEVNQRWAHWFRDIVAEITTPGGDPIRYRQVFHSDGEPIDGPFERGCFTLVIDPDRAAEYDALHAEPWPEMVAAIEAAGYRNYSGFRRGAHVVYYGEYHPDMATVIARINATDVAARWGNALDGVITTFTDTDGNLFTAREIHHND